MPRPLTIKIALTIDVNYLPNWKVSEGLRELVQNWLDAADDLGTPGEIEYSDKVLKLINPGANLTREALLLGSTSKVNREDQRGQFGEGLKLGTLALARSKRMVTVRTQNELWRARIQESDDFAGRKVLTWTISEVEKGDDVVVSIYPVEREEYEALQSAFLHFSVIEKHHTTYYGRLLMDDAYKGKVFVKGILVMEDEELSAGYDLSRVQVDRDRKMIRDYDLAHHTSEIWRATMISGKITPKEILDMLEHGRKDVDGAKYWCGSAKEQIAKEFIKRYPDTIPVLHGEEVGELGHFGAHGLQVPRGLFEVLKGASGIKNADAVKQKLGQAPKKEYSWEELGQSKVDNLLWAAGELESVLNNTDVLSRIRVVDFHDANLQGLYRRQSNRASDNKIDLASRVLQDRIWTLQVLVHEFAHDYGNDGDKIHVHMIEETWKKLATSWVGATESRGSIGEYNY